MAALSGNVGDAQSSNGANKTEDGPLDWESSVAPENFSVLLLTWNTHGESFDRISNNEDGSNIVEKIFREGFCSLPEDQKGDMIIVSLQEIVELDLDHILYDSNNDIEKQVGAWEKGILNTMNGARTGKGSEDIDEYSILTSRAIVGTYMLVAVKKKHIDFVDKIEVEDIRLQRYLGGAVHLGNKACLLTRFSIYRQSFSIASVHLAAHRNNMDERIEQLQTIFSEAWTAPTTLHAQKFNKHDHCFFLGDFNSRIVESFDTKEAYTLAGNGVSSGPNVSKHLSRLRQYDQLGCLMRGDAIMSDNLKAESTNIMDVPDSFVKFNLRHWQENDLNFCPTYKLNLKTWNESKGYKVDKTDFDKYAPSWTDRILHKCLDSTCHENTYYKSFELEKPVSDHFPVQCIVNIKMKNYIKTKREHGDIDNKSKSMAENSIIWDHFNICGTNDRKEGINGNSAGLNVNKPKVV